MYRRRPDQGRIRYRSREIRPTNYREANLIGISRVFQEQALIPNIAVYENILLSHENHFVRIGQVLNRRRMVAVARRIGSSRQWDLISRFVGARATTIFPYGSRSRSHGLVWFPARSSASRLQ